MFQLRNIKKWLWVHRWTSLICTLFLLLLCLTGLPLIFGEEIDEWLNPGAPYEMLPANTPMGNLDSMVHKAQQRYPKEVISYVYIDDEEPQVLLGMIPHYDADPELSHDMKFDARTAKLLKDEPPERDQKTFIGLMLSLHTDLFMGLPGELFMGFMGLLFVVSIISGVVLYGPFTKKLDFGTVRRDRSRRMKWLDLHNLLGIAIMVWLAVVGITGVINELSTPLFGLWQQTDVRDMLKKYENKALPVQGQLSSADAAYNTAKKALPGMTVTTLVFPGNQYGSPYHYLLWAKGNTPLTSRLFSPVLVEANSGELAAIVQMPWYLRFLEVSRPLHFGDYGGTPLKIIWALFDIAAIVVLITGVYLWFARRKNQEAYFAVISPTTINTENE
jgi:uncharacterized iron-regulated membrane protein